MNAISMINPYKHKGQWVFDDESKELDKEPFVAGADDLITMLLNGEDKCTILFSESAFKGHEHVVTHVKPEMDGNTYFHEEFQHELWLCPALLKYFEKPPKQIYFQIKQ